MIARPSLVLCDRGMMKTRISYLVLGALLGVLLMFGALALTAQSSNKQQWEYMNFDWLAAATSNQYIEDVGTVKINGDDPEPGAPQRISDVLNQYAADGWELVAVEPHQLNLSDGGANILTRYFLKRAVS